MYAAGTVGKSQQGRGSSARRRTLLHCNDAAYSFHHHVPLLLALQARRPHRTQQHLQQSGASPCWRSLSGWGLPEQAETPQGCAATWRHPPAACAPCTEEQQMLPPPSRLRDQPCRHAQRCLLPALMGLLIFPRHLNRSQALRAASYRLKDVELKPSRKRRTCGRCRLGSPCAPDRAQACTAAVFQCPAGGLPPPSCPPG